MAAGSAEAAAAERGGRREPASGVLVAREVDAVAVARDRGHDGGQSARPRARSHGGGDWTDPVKSVAEDAPAIALAL